MVFTHRKIVCRIISTKTVVLMRILKTNKVYPLISITTGNDGEQTFSIQYDEIIVDFKESECEFVYGYFK